MALSAVSERPRILEDGRRATDPGPVSRDVRSSFDVESSRPMVPMRKTISGRVPSPTFREIRTRTRCWLRMLKAICCLFQFFMLLVPMWHESCKRVVEKRCEFKEQVKHVNLLKHTYQVLIYNVSSTFVLASWLYYEKHSNIASSLAKHVGRCLFWSWAVLVFRGAKYASVWCVAECPGHVLTEMLEPLAAGLIVFSTYLFQSSMLRRVELVEDAFGEELGSFTHRGRSRSTSHRIYSRRSLPGTLSGNAAGSCWNWMTSSVHTISIAECRGVTRIIGASFAAADFGIASGLLYNKLQDECRSASIYWHAAYLSLWIFWSLTRTISFVLISMLTKRALQIVECALQAICAPGKTAGYLRAEAEWARGVVRRMSYALLVPCLVFCLANSLQILFFGIALVNKLSLLNVAGADFFVNSYIRPITFAFPTVVEAICLFFIGGLFQAETPKIHLDVEQLRLKSIKSGQAMPDDKWQDTVTSLAHRSIEVVALLEFYRKLGPGGTIMHHYDPTRSTTNDVVRGAIIPMSRIGDDGFAFASVVGKPGLPDRMVTHSWNTLFVELVASVVADALGIDEYESVQKALSHGDGEEELESRLQRTDVVHLRYWICAFCVNQHAAICGGFGQEPQPNEPSYHENWARWDQGRRDTVTREIYSKCSCKQEKFFNDSPNECELNKFDDMMAYIKREVPHFQQVIAVGSLFEVFFRAWCVAELVEAHKANIPQRVRLGNNSQFDLTACDWSLFKKLATISVHQCSASRIEDKEAILDKIDDKTAFDIQLQMLIFGDRGLLRQKFDGFGTLEAAVRVARRSQWIINSGSFQRLPD